MIWSRLSSSGERQFLFAACDYCQRATGMPATASIGPDGASGKEDADARLMGSLARAGSLVFGYSRLVMCRRCLDPLAEGAERVSEGGEA